MLNLRFKYVVLSSAFFMAHNIPIANKMIANMDQYTDQELFDMACKIMIHLRDRARTKTLVYGRENIKEDENYILYSNHQGKYDALGIILGFGSPLGVLWAKEQARRLVGRQVCSLLKGEVIDLNDMRDTVRAIKSVGEKVKNGQSFLIFPEGGYTDNKNNLQDFKSGCFSCCLKSQKPIIPVAIYDSYKSMNSNTFERVTTQVHFLKSIPFEEYGHMSKAEIAGLVKARIEEKLSALRPAD